ncbi:DUF11 domain-containing protein, partial [Methanobrevibacter oralis]|uniref:DUF11 domain-containing protein n=1 Tax=Methanobrevibacter oralis TaxID=66851 RepID=UPI001C73BEBE
MSDKAMVNVGENLTYTITVTNKGSSVANGVVVEELIPNGLTLINNSWDTSQWTKVGNTWKLINGLNGGSSAVLKLVFTVNGNATGAISNVVVVKSNETGNGTNVSNNNTTLTNVSLNVTKVSDKAMVNVGENLTYTITVTNKGSSVANGVVVEELI